MLEEEEEEEEKFSLGPLWLLQGCGGLAPHALRMGAAFQREGMEGRKLHIHPFIHTSQCLSCT